MALCFCAKAIKCLDSDTVGKHLTLDIGSMSRNRNNQLKAQIFSQTALLLSLLLGKYAYQNVLPAGTVIGRRFVFRAAFT